MTSAYEVRARTATAVFDFEDVYARERGVSGRHPRPIGDVRLTAVARYEAGAPVDLAPPMPLVTRINPSGYRLFLGQTGASGEQRSGLLRPGRYAMEVEAGLYQPVRVDVDLPSSAPVSLDLAPGHAYPFPNAFRYRLSAGEPCTAAGKPQSQGPTLLRGGLHHPDGRGIAGATVTVPGESNVYLTDASGQWVLWFPEGHATGPQTVRFRLDANVGPIDVTQVCVVHGCETSLSQASFRGRVLAASGAGVAGATVRVGGHPGQATTDGDGAWAYYFGLNQSADVVSVTATLPAGQSLTQTNVQIAPRASAALPAFRFA